MRRPGRAGMWMSLLTVGMALGCAGSGPGRDGWEPPTVVRIQSDEACGWFPYIDQFVSATEEGRTQALLLRDGDYLWCESAGPVRYEARDGQTLTISHEGSTTRMGEKTVAVELDEDGTAWLRDASEGELRELRTLLLPGKMDEEGERALERLASVNRIVDLAAGDSLDGLDRALKLFEPRMVSTGIEGSSSVLGELLANQPRLEMLHANTAADFDFLRSLPRLRHLTWNVEESGPLPPGLTELRSLYVGLDPGKGGWKALEAAPAGLLELSLVGDPDLSDLSGIVMFADLQEIRLFTPDDQPVDLSALDSLHRLRRAYLPSGTTQDQFEKFARAHPDLAVLEIPESHRITDLTPLKTFRNLQALVIGDPLEQLDVLQGLTSLRFLGISRGAYDGSPEQVAAIRKALPDTLVVRMEPFCLGSGWILLLAPAIALFWFLRRRPRRASARPA